VKIINIYSTKNINILSVIITIIIILILNLFNNSFLKIEVNESLEENIVSENIDSNNKDEEKLEDDIGDWYLEISSINLKAPINETTEMDVLNKFIGHFEDTALKDGNVGLAAHNRGYENNYFENLKNVKKGQEIKYKYFDFEKTYIIDKIEIIKDTNWSYLESTKDNKITLITCVENKPSNRLCVQATEKKF